MEYIFCELNFHIYNIPCEYDETGRERAVSDVPCLCTTYANIKFNYGAKDDDDEGDDDKRGNEPIRVHNLISASSCFTIQK